LLNGVFGFTPRIMSFMMLSRKPRDMAF
jgi:hypothetical protein